jgi:hypothetical protein
MRTIATTITVGRANPAALFILIPITSPVADGCANGKALPGLAVHYNYRIKKGESQLKMRHKAGEKSTGLK